MTLRGALQTTSALILGAALSGFVGYRLGVGPCGGSGLPFMLIYSLLGLAACIFLVIDLVLWVRSLLSKRTRNGGAEAPPFTNH